MKNQEGTPAGPQEEIYLLQRDKAESERLNEQHKFLVKICGGGPIHESIPKDRLFAIADVATGTGIWLNHVSDLLKNEYPTDRPRYYHGFDISDAQFPADRGSIKYSVHDCLKPFPAEHHNRYDLVHVRLLVAAIKEEDYKVIVANLVPLLKPGGYLQWDDLDIQSFFPEPSAQQITPYFDTMRLIASAQRTLGVSRQAPETVYQAAQAAGLVDIVKHDFHTADHPELATRTQHWVFRVFTTMIPNALRKAKLVTDEEKVQQEAQRHLEIVRKAFFEEGVVPNGSMGQVVARRAA